jgi:FKBP-type peptidyl-prolyl cis-trans isomerase
MKIAPGKSFNEELDCNSGWNLENRISQFQFMRTTFFTTVIFMATAALVFADDGTNVQGDEKSKVSYAVGMMFGHTLQQQAIDADSDMLLRGIKDEQSGGKTLLTTEEAQAVVKDYQEKRRAGLTVKNEAEGEAFLATNKDQPDVKILPAIAPDGKPFDLQYKVIKEGTGISPTPADTVTVNYRGTYIDGTEFDSSYDRGQPAQFPVGRVIRGLSVALTHMKVGSKWQLFIPSELAYGTNGYGSIGPNATLIFEVELIGVQRPISQSAPPSVAPQPLTSDIIKVQGTNIVVLKPEDVQKLRQSQDQPGK